MWQIFTLVILFGVMAAMSFVPGREQAVNLVDATGFLMLAAFTMGELFRRINLPALLGYIIAGLVFGPDIMELVAGPDAAIQLLPRNITDADQLAYIEILTIGVIGTLGGGELNWKDLRDQFGSILKLNLLAYLAIVPATGLAVYLLAGYAPDVVRFVYEVDLPAESSRISAAVLMGILGFAMSPAATLAIIQENRSEGRFTSFVLGAVIVAELLLVATFLVGKSFSSVLLEQGSFALQPLLASLPGIGAEFGWALVIGGITGLVFILYFRFVSREMIVFTVGAFFVASYACEQLHAERLLAFITAGFIVQNFSRHGHDMIEALERISLPVFVIYFALQAVDLNLMGIPRYAALIAILTAIRTAGLYGSINLATSFGDWTLSEEDREYLWLSFFSRGSVDLVLVSLLANPGNVFAWGEQFQTVIMGVVVIHMIAGPPLLTYALDRVGETDRDEESDPEDEKLIEEDQDVREAEHFLEDPLPIPDLHDDELRDHLEGLRDGLQELYRREFAGPARSHEEAMASILDRIDTTIGEALDDLEQILREARDSETVDFEEAAQQIRERHVQLRRSLQPPIDRIEELGPFPITPERIDTFLREVRDSEEFDRHFRVTWAPRMWEVHEEDSVAVRACKLLRRLRKSLLGPGERDVPVGQLWRYYVELSLPEYLAGAVATTAEESEAYWFELAAQLRETDAVFETSIRSLERTAGETAEGPASDRESEDAEFDREGYDDEAIEPETTMPTSASGARIPDLAGLELPEPLAAALKDRPDFDYLAFLETGDDPDELLDDPGHCLERVQRVREEFEARDERLHTAEMSFRNQLLDRLAVALENAFSDFLEGAGRAGVLEFPKFRYRPSSRYDLAQAAERRLDERLRSGSKVIAGCQGWIVAEQHLTLFLHWYRDYRERVDSVLDVHIRRKALERLRSLASRCGERPDGWSERGEPAGDAEKPGASELVPAETWASWFDEEIAPSLRRTREAFNRAMMEVSEGRSTQRLLDVLENRVSRFPNDLELLEHWPEEPPSPSAEVSLTDVPLRDWFMSELIREIGLRFVDFNERAERTLRRSLLGLQDVEEILDYHLRTGPDQVADEEGEPEEIALRGLDRAVGRIRELGGSLAEDVEKLRRWIDVELNRIVTSASIPFLAKRVSEISLRFADRPIDPGSTTETGLFSPLADSIQYRWKRLRDWIGPAYQQFRTDLAETLTDSETESSRAEVRTRLVRHRRHAVETIPSVYRRLFRPVPVDIPDFYIERSALEETCLEGVRRWLRGESCSLLLYGDRGAGKRTLMQHLLPLVVRQRIEPLDENQIETIHFGERLTEEPEICRALSPLIDGPPAYNFQTLADEIHGSDQKKVAGIADLLSLFHRTGPGLDRLEQFLQFVSATSDDIFWMFGLEEATAEFLDTAIGLYDYFSYNERLEPFDSGEIERMILTRHRVSGFDLEFERPERRFIDRVRHPIAAGEASRHPRRAYFERLGRLSGGNPMLALVYWLESVQPDPGESSQFRVEPLPEEEIDILPPLSLEQKMIVASLVRHGYISIRALAEVFRAKPEEMRVELEHLERLGFVELTPGRDQTFRLRQLPQGLATPELRERNLL